METFQCCHGDCAFFLQRATAMTYTALSLTEPFAKEAMLWHRSEIFPSSYGCKVSAGWKEKGESWNFECRRRGVGRHGLYLVSGNFPWSWLPPTAWFFGRYRSSWSSGWGKEKNYRLCWLFLETYEVCSEQECNSLLYKLASNFTALE